MLEDILCTRCGCSKSSNDFHQDLRKTNGRQSHCKACAREWRMAVPCTDCGKPCQRNYRQCRQCSNASRQTSRAFCLDCGATINARGTRCRHCWLASVRVPGPRKSKQWKVPAERRLNTSAARRLRAQVLREEPTCQIRVPGVCTEVSTTWDHIVPRAVDPSLTLVRSNVRGACWECNSFIAGRPVSLRPRTVGACLECGADFVRWGAGHIYCSKTCQGRTENRGKPWRVYFPECRLCGAVFCSRTSRGTVCAGCQAELNARANRDLYRVRVGLPVDPDRPTKRFALLKE